MVLSAGVGVLAWLLQQIEVWWLGHAVLDALVLAIIFGVLLRAVWVPGTRWTPGIRFAGRQVLELAVVLLGASINAAVLIRAGAGLLLAIVGIVVLGTALGIALGRIVGLTPKLAILVACGNAICGNSAIAAVAPVIEADSDDVAAAIAFTAVLGVVVVVTLPLLIPLLDLSNYQYGVLAGATVYAVPQVLAATFPVSATSVEVGTWVKLLRVLMLGPVVLFFALRSRTRQVALRTTQFVPWFLIGFVILAMGRSLGLLPGAFAEPLREASRWLATLAMAALGLGVDVRALTAVGGKVIAVVTASLAALIALSLIFIRLLGV